MPQILAVAGSLFLYNQPLPLSLENLVYEGGLVFFPEYKVLTVSGPDAEAFLSNQTTNNVKALIEGTFQTNSLLDLAAKVVGFFLLGKESPENFKMVVHTELAAAVVERLEKYLVAEEVEINEEEIEVFGVIGNKSIRRFPEGLKGQFAGEDFVLRFDRPELEPVDPELFKTLLIATAYPFWGETFFELELFNNTMLADLAYDKDKGCFLGQETVAKIETRRGAAFKPMLLRTDEKLDLQYGEPLRANGKKIGKFIASSGNLTLASLNRESRIEGLELSIEEPKELKAKAYYPPIYKKGDKAQEYYHHGIELFNKNDENEAELYLLKAIDCDPVYEEAYESLGVLYGRQGRYEEAIDYMRKLSKLNPKSVMAHTNMSLYYMKVGEIEKAEEQKSQATIKQFQQLGDEAERKKRMEEQEKRKKEELEKREGMFREVLEIDPEDTLANYGLGEIEREKGNFEEAIALLKAAIQAKKNYSVAWLSLGKAYLAAEKKQLAKETLEEGLKIAGKNGDLMPANEMQRILSEF